MKDTYYITITSLDVEAYSVEVTTLNLMSALIIVLMAHPGDKDLVTSIEHDALRYERIPSRSFDPC